MADPSIGMMDGAYFVGRKEIVDWVNNALGLSLSKVEQTANGAIACQLLDVIFPGQVAMAKVNWGARVDHEFIPNYKVLQNAFDRLSIERHIDVDKLIRAKYQDNLEFMQWFKRFYEMHTPQEDYDPAAARLRGRGGQQFNQQFGASGLSSARGPSTAAAAKATRAPVAGRTAAGRTSKPRPTSSDAKPAHARTGAAAPATAAGPAAGVSASAEIAELQKQNSELRITIDGLEKERDFYFDKLREVEMLLQGKEEDTENEWIQKVFEILYATTDDFVNADEGDNAPVNDEQEQETF